MLNVGMTYTDSKIVEQHETASKIGSGGLDVFSTPMMIAFMEYTSYKLAEQGLSENETTVGTEVNIKHLKASPVGAKVTCNAELIEIDRRRLVFKVTVTEGDKIIGDGFHTRFIINANKFIENIEKDS